jgi:hypothetical protein
MFKLSLTKGRNRNPKDPNDPQPDVKLPKLVKKNNLVYQTDYKIPSIPKKIRQYICSKHAVKLSHYNIHHLSNISRVEYEIERHKLKHLFENTSVNNYAILVASFFILFENDVRLTCNYSPNGDRRYKIFKDGVQIYDAILDNPVLDDDEEL